jgi:glycosyltransferase A (GT-A) superfamily protein (DUF2064 family)
VSGAIAIFVKTPGYSPLKTRLAASAGSAVALDWHVRAARTVAAVAGAAAAPNDAVVYWAVAEPAAIGAGAWAGLANLAQGEGGLGARMERVHAELVRRHGHGLLLGADAPQLAVEVVGEALVWCAVATPRQALGPARDGGFWLYGANRTAPLADWEAVAYSRADTASRFRAVFAAHGTWRMLPTLTDVDQGDDLDAMRRELAGLPSPLAAQRELGVWLDAAFGAAGRGRA